MVLRSSNGGLDASFAAILERRRSFILLLAILLLGAGLRLARLWNDTPPLFADEIEQYVSVHSIFTTGADVGGRLRPFLDCRLGRNPPIYGLAGYMSTLVLGNSTFGWRFPAAVFGLVTIVLIFYIVRELTKRDAIALAAALLLAIEPDHIHFSRIGWEPATVLPFLLAALWLLLVALRDPTRPLSLSILVMAAIPLGLCPYSYPTTSLYAVVLVGGLLMLHRGIFHDVRSRRALMVAGAIALLIAAPGLITMATDPHTFGRSARISTFAHGLSGSSIEHFINNYFSHFSWSYLFYMGSPDPRYLCGYGLLHWWYAPLIVLGAVYSGRYVRSKALCWWLWIWLAVYPIGGALTNDGVIPHAPRTIAGTPALCIFAAIGLYALLIESGRLIPAAQLRRGYRLGLSSVLVACAFGSVWSFSRYYFGVYPTISAQAWESGTREAFAAVRVRQTEYRRLCTNGISYWHIQSLERYYLPETPLKIFEGFNHGECTMPATLLLSTSLVRLPGFHVVNVTNALDGKRFAVLQARPNEPKTAHEPKTAILEEKPARRGKPR